MCLDERSFGSCSTWGNGGQMTHLGERCASGGLRVGGNYANFVVTENPVNSFLTYTLYKTHHGPAIAPFSVQILNCPLLFLLAALDVPY